MKKIIVINGSGGVGKDTFIEIIKNICSKNIIIINISTIDPIKEIARKIGWNGKKDEKGRQLLSDLKDATSRYNNLSLNYIKNEINKLDESLNYLIFVHARESTEINKLNDYYKNHLITLLIRRRNIKRFNNHADFEVEDYSYDYIIENNGSFNDLKKHAKLFLSNIGLL